MEKLRFDCGVRVSRLVVNQANLVMNMRAQFNADVFQSGGICDNEITSGDREERN